MLAPPIPMIQVLLETMLRGRSKYRVQTSEWMRCDGTRQFLPRQSARPGFLKSPVMTSGCPPGRLFLRSCGKYPRVEPLGAPWLSTRRTITILSRRADLMQAGTPSG